MRRIAVNTVNSSYEVIVGESISKLASYYKIGSGVIIVEEAVAKNADLANLGLPIKVVAGGESIKNIAKIEDLYKIFIELGLDKSSVIVAVGGGALTDAVAFAAATFHRGLACITVPTTLLSQVDASIGGKNGVNFAGIKNLIGTITQPKLVICDFNFLKTLPASEISNGVAEIIKAGIIADASLIDLLKKSAQEIFSLNTSVLEEVIGKAVQVKADIVTRDEKESHERMKLNFGHTIGHALEPACKLSHGQAVACGMVLETKLAVMLNLCAKELISELELVCKLYKLPTTVDFEVDEICQHMLQDKKKRSDDLQFALPIKNAQVEIVTVKINEIKKHLSDLRIA